MGIYVPSALGCDTVHVTALVAHHGGADLSSCWLRYVSSLTAGVELLQLGRVLMLLVIERPEYTCPPEVSCEFNLTIRVALRGSSMRGVFCAPRSFPSSRISVPI